MVAVYYYLFSSFKINSIHYGPYWVVFFPRFTEAQALLGLEDAGF